MSRLSFRTDLELIALAQADDGRALDELLRRYDSWLRGFCANEMRSRSIEVDEVISVAQEAFMSVILECEHSALAKLTTVARSYVRGALHDFVVTLEAFPVVSARTSRRVRAIKRAAGDDFDKAQELRASGEYGLVSAHTLLLLWNGSPVVSFSTPVTAEGEGMTLGETLSTSEPLDMQVVDRAHARLLLAELPAIEREVIERLYGIDQAQQTAQEIAADLDVSASAVGRLKAVALGRLQAHAVELAA